MAKKTEVNMGIIDPTKLDDLQQRVLKRYLMQGIKHKGSSVFDKGYLNEIVIGDVIYHFELSHDIAHRTRASDPTQHRFEIVSNDKPLGKGGFGAFLNVEGTLEPALGGRLIYKKKQRGVKYQEHSDIKNPLDAFDKEIKFTQKIPYMHAKKPTIVMHSLDRSSSYTAMKKLPGKDLSDVLRDKKNPLTTDEKINISIKLIRVLQEYFHDQNIIHRDLKPHNIRYDRTTGEVYIFDMGLSKKTTEVVSETVGTPQYMTQEQYKNVTTDAYSDNYTLGKILSEVWEMPHMARSVKNTGNDKQFLIDLYLLTEKDVTFDMTKFNNLKDTNLDKQIVIDVISGMTKAAKEDRHAMSLENALSHFEELRLNRSLSLTEYPRDGERYQNIKQALDLGIAAWKEFRQLKKNQAAAGNYDAVIRRDLQNISDDKEAVKAYVGVLGVNAFKDLESKADIIAKMDANRNEYLRLREQFNQKKDAIEKLLYHLDKHQNSKLYKLINDLLIDLKATKGKHGKLSGHFDDIVVINKKMSDTLNKVDRKIANIDMVYHRSNVNNPHKLSNVMQKLIAVPEGDRGSLPTLIKHKVLLYIASSYTKEATKDSSRSSSQRRLKDVEDILDIINGNQDVDTMKNAVRNRLKSIEKGHTFFSGGSELADNVEAAIKFYESKAKTSPLRPGKKSGSS